MIQFRTVKRALEAIHCVSHRPDRLRVLRRICAVTTKTPRDTGRCCPNFIEAGHGSAMPDVTARKGRTQVPTQGRASVATRPLTLVREARGTEVAPVEPDGEGVLGEQAESAQSRRLPGPPCSVRAESLGGCWSKKRPSSSAPNCER